MPSDKDRPPFHRGDIVISNLKHLTVKEGDRVRVLDCVASENCGSGWLVSATSQTRGKIAGRAPIAMQGVDSDWFRLVRCSHDSS